MSKARAERPGREALAGVAASKGRRAERGEAAGRQADNRVGGRKATPHASLRPWLSCVCCSFLLFPRAGTTITVYFPALPPPQSLNSCRFLSHPSFLFRVSHDLRCAALHWSHLYLLFFSLTFNFHLICFPLVCLFFPSSCHFHFHLICFPFLLIVVFFPSYLPSSPSSPLSISSSIMSACSIVASPVSILQFPPSCPTPRSLSLTPSSYTLKSSSLSSYSFY